MSVWRTQPTRADKRAYHRLRTGIEWHNRKNMKTFRFLTLTGIGNYRRNFDMLRRLIRKQYGIFEYFCTRTEEGQSGVLYLLYVGKYMDFEQLQDSWKKLSGAWNLNIQKVKDFLWQGFEMTRQQLTARYSWSKRWLPEGIIEAWKAFKSTKNPNNYNSDGGWIGPSMESWKEYVRNYQPTRQQVLTA